MFLLFVIGIIIMAVALFSAQNAAPVAVSFLIWRFTASFSIVVLLAFLVGAVIGMSVLSWSRIRQSMKKREKERTERMPGKP